MEYAVIKSGGKQHVVKVGDKILLDRLKEKQGEKVEFTDVLLVRKGEQLLIGTPFVKNALVKGKVLDNIKGKKIRIAKFRAKTNYRRVMGFRPYYSKVSVEEIAINTLPSSKENHIKNMPKKLTSSRRLSREKLA